MLKGACSMNLDSNAQCICISSTQAGLQSRASLPVAQESAKRRVLERLLEDLSWVSVCRRGLLGGLGSSES